MRHVRAATSTAVGLAGFCCTLVALAVAWHSEQVVRDARRVVADWRSSREQW